MYNNRMKSHKRAILICFIFLFVGIFQLKDYGINEDSPFHFLRGQAYLHLLTTGENQFDQPRLTSPVLFIPDQRISTYKYSSWESNVAPIRTIANNNGNSTIQERFSRYQAIKGRQSFFKHNAWGPESYVTPGHPPLSDVFEALSNKLFYEKLGVLNDVEAYHVYVLFTAILAGLALYYFTYKIAGLTAGLFALLSLLLYPHYFAESHFNIKDIPELCFFAITVISFYFWVTTCKLDWFITGLIAFIIAVGTKLNVLFVPIIVIPWLISIRRDEIVKKWFTKKLIVYGLLFLGISLTLFILLWPALWESPIRGMLAVVHAYIGEGNVDLRVQIKNPFMLPFGVNVEPLLLLFSQTPPITLLCGLIGLVSLFSKRVRQQLSHNAGLLVLFWFLVPLLRVLRPGAETFSSMRTYVEFLPAFAFFCGLGADHIVKFVSRYVSKKKALIGTFTLYVIFLLAILIRFHPNENMYFNMFVGGPGGAEKKQLYTWRTTYNNPYRQALNWLNTHADKNAKLAYLDGTMQAMPSIWIRRDISFGSHFSGFNRAGEYIVTMVYPQPPSVFAALYMQTFLDPVYEIKQNGVVLARVYKNDTDHVKRNLREFSTISGPFVKIDKQDPNLGNAFELNLTKRYLITSITFELPKTDCINRDGLFSLGHYTVPQRVDRSPSETVFYFPATKTNKITFYGIYSDSCLLRSSIKEITVVKE